MENSFIEGFEEYQSIFIKVVDALKNYFSSSERDIIMEGEEKILQHVEYADPEKIKEFLNVVTSKDKIMNIMLDNDKNIKTRYDISKMCIMSGIFPDIPERIPEVTAAVMEFFPVCG
jgi:transcriptional regulator of heat shock response